MFLHTPFRGCWHGAAGHGGVAPAVEWLCGPTSAAPRPAGAGFEAGLPRVREEKRGVLPRSCSSPTWGVVSGAGASAPPEECATGRNLTDPHGVSRRPCVQIMV